MPSNNLTVSLTMLALLYAPIFASTQMPDCCPLSPDTCCPNGSEGMLQPPWWLWNWSQDSHGNCVVLPGSTLADMNGDGLTDLVVGLETISPKGSAYRVTFINNGCHFVMPETFLHDGYCPSHGNLKFFVKNFRFFLVTL